MLGRTALLVMGLVGLVGAGAVVTLIVSLPDAGLILIGFHE